MEFSPEELNNSKLCVLVLDEFPVVLHKTFVFMWDRLHVLGPQKWDDSALVHKMFLTKEDGKTKLPIDKQKSCKEWDCTFLFQAILYSHTFGIPDVSGKHCTLSELYVKPPPSGTFHDSVQSPTGNIEQTIALAVDQLRLLHNTLCHSSSKQNIDQATFDNYIKLTKDAFTALGENSTRIDDIRKLTEQDFPIARLQQLENELEREKGGALEFKQIDNCISEIKSQVENQGTSGRSQCSHLPLSLINALVYIKTVEESGKRKKHLNLLLSCLQGLEMDGLQNLNVTSKDVYCIVHKVWISGRLVYSILTSNPGPSPSQIGKELNSDCTYATLESGIARDPNVFLFSPSNYHRKMPPLILFWKTARVLETKELSCLDSAMHESVNMLFLQPEFEKECTEGQDFYMELTLPGDPSVLSSLSTQIDYLPLLVQLQLSESNKECDTIDSAVFPSGHVSYFSYRFSNQKEVDFVFGHLTCSLDKILVPTEVQEVVISAERNAAFFRFSCSNSSLSVVAEKDSVTVKCRTLWELESNCICSSVRNTLENTMGYLCRVARLHMESILQLPCEEIGGSHCCRDFQRDTLSSCHASETANVCPCASRRDPEYEGEPSKDMLQNKDEVKIEHADHADDHAHTLGESLWCALEYPSNNGFIASDVQASPCSDENTEHFLSLGSTSSLNSYSTSPSSACEIPVILKNMSPSLGKEATEPCDEGNISNTENLQENSSTVLVDCSESHLTLQEKPSLSSFGGNMPEECSVMRSSYEEGLSSGEGTETRETVLLEDMPEGKHDEQIVHTGCNTASEAGHHSGPRGTPEPSFSTVLRGNGEESFAIDSLISQLKSDVEFYQHQCHELRQQISQVKEKLQLSEAEKQQLQFDVGRQSFLECKEKRSVKVLQSSMAHVSEQSKSCAANGSSHVMSEMDKKLLGGAGPLQEPRSSLRQKLLEISNSLSEAELTRMKLLARPKVNGPRLNEIREGFELFEELESTGELFIRELLKGIRRDDLLEKLDTPLLDNTESGSCLTTGQRMQDSMNESPDEDSSSRLGLLEMPSGDVNLDLLPERYDDAGDGTSDGTHMQGNKGNGMAPGVNQVDSGLNMSSGNSDDSGGDMAVLSMNPSCSSAVSSSESPASSALIVQPLRVDSNSSSRTSHDACDGLPRATLDRHSAVDPSSDEKDSLESSILLSEADGEFESGEIETAGACAARDGRIDSGHVSSPDRGRRRSNLKHTPGLQQDVLADGDMSLEQNGSGACGVGKDSKVDQSVSDLSTQSNEWQRLGARPRDRPPMKRVPVEPSLVDLVPQEVAGPVAHGLAGAFLARHSQDKGLHESLYQGSGEQVLPDDSSSQGASYVDDPYKAKPYFGDCQVAPRPDAHSRSWLVDGANTEANLEPHGADAHSRSLFPFLSSTGVGYDRRNAEGGYAYNGQFNGNTGLEPGASSSYLRGNNFSVNGNFPSSSAFSPSNCDSLRTDFVLDTSRSTGMEQLDRMPYIPLDGQIESGLHTSVQRNQRLHSGMTNGLSVGTTEPQLTPPIYGAQRYSGLNGNTSTNSGLSASTGNMARVDVGSSGLPSTYSIARSNGADSGLVRVAESTRTSQYVPVSANNNTLNTAGDRLVAAAAAANREGNLDPPYIEAAFPSGNSRVSRLIAGANTEPRGAEAALPSANAGGSMLNRDFGTSSVESTDNSLLALEQRVEEACAMVERVLRAREERELFGREIEKKEREIRELRARKRREREARELEEASRWPQEQEAITGRSQWLCEHYQRHCRVRFPCCSHFYSCHRCHNNSKACDNEEAKASHATHLKCSFCQHEQEIGEDSGKCRSCGGNMSAYFCSICKHFTSVDKNPYHCEKCGICRIHKDKSFHCDVCNVCLDKRLEGKHKCRPDSGHDECCICLEDAFSGCQILPCSHKVHRECAIAMIQNGIRTCPVCRHPLYSSASE